MSEPHMAIVYDGECPFCSSYVSMMRLRQAAGQVELIDARSPDPRVDALQEAGFDLDAGMAVLWHGDVYYGDRAIHILATLTADGGGLFSRLQRLIFRSPRRAARLYPVLVASRRAFLRLAGRSRLPGSR